MSLSIATGLTDISAGGVIPISPVALTLPGTPLAVYSVVKFTGWAGACVRIERSSDSTQQDVGFTARGYMDVDSAFAFAGSSNIRVVTWYDQSGNGLDATASANWPTIINGNAIGGVQPITFCETAGFGSVCQLTMPAGVTVSTQNFTVCMAYASGGGSLNFNGLFQLDTQVPLWWEKYTGVLQGSALFTGGDKKLFTPRNAEIDSITLSGSAAQRILTNNGSTQTTGSAYALATPAGGVIGTGSTVTTTAIEVFAFVVYNSALTAGNKTAVDGGFSTAYKAGQGFTAKVIYDGDSITAGFTTDAYLFGWPRVVNTINGNGAAVYNVSVPGSTINTCYTQRAQITGRYDSSYSKNVSVIFAGTNDLDNRASGTIVGYGTTIWTTYTLPYIQAMQAAGFTRVIVGTAIARTWIGSAQDKIDKEAERLVYNQLIRDNAAFYGYTLLDFAYLPQMSVSTNTTYFVDGVHPTRLGYNVMGTYAAPIIAAYT